MKKQLLVHGVWAAVCVAAWFGGRSSVDQEDSGSARQAHGKRSSAVRAPVPFAGPALEASADDLLASKEYAGKSLAEVFRAVLTERDETARRQKFDALLSKLTAADAMALQQVFLDYDKTNRWFIPEYHAFMHRWGQVDGTEAAKFTLEKRKSADNAGIVQKLMSGWSDTSPQAAVDWINNHPDMPDWMEKAAMKGLVNGLAVRDLDMAAKLVTDHLDSPAGREVVTALLDHFVQGPGIAKAEEWFSTIPDKPELEITKASGFRAIFDGHLRGGDETLDAAAAFVHRYAASPWFPAQACSDTVERLQHRDPAAAAKWVESLPEGAARVVAFKIIRGEL